MSICQATGEEYCAHDRCWKEWLEKMEQQEEQQETTESVQDRYEAIEMVIKVREDGLSWSDYLFDLITENCEGDPESEENTCTCGMESMGGMTGTYDQCYEWTNNVATGISPIMIARAVTALWERRYGDENTDKIIEWARKEIEFEEYFENKTWEEEDDDE